MQAAQLARQRRYRCHAALPHNRCDFVATGSMHAYVYKSQRKADTYVYLATRDGFERMPETLRAQLGPLQFVLDVALTPDRKLARVDAALVRARLAEQGFHVQMPPPDGWDPSFDALTADGIKGTDA